jgi:hypothetical protein
MTPELLLELAQCLHDIADICEMIHEMQDPLHNIAERHPEDKEDIHRIMDLCNGIEPVQDQLRGMEYKLVDIAKASSQEICSTCHGCGELVYGDPLAEKPDIRPCHDCTPKYKREKNVVHGRKATARNNGKSKIKGEDQ